MTRFAEKQLNRLPVHIVEALEHWIEIVEQFGIYKIRMVPGYHDEPLKGQRSGQRSIRLNRSYRALYIELENTIELRVIEVNKHEY